tara:strand:- start:10 stop:516 length:507 start_codon:yes stop_codon:yes gene_type:complete
MLYRDYRFVEGFDNNYIISNFGEVWSLWFGKVRLLKPSPNNNGYLQLDLCANGKRASRKIHVLVGEAFVGLRTGSLTYDHKDNNNQNNRSDNIRLATKSEQSENQKLRKTNKLGIKHICETVNKSGNEYYQIKIKRNGKRVHKYFRKDKYSLEQVISEKDKILLELRA